MSSIPNVSTDPQFTGDLADVCGDFVTFDGERCYRISNCQRMPDFFMTLASSGNHWMFLSSRGAVTAGRKDPDHSLFPYYSADKLIDVADATGPKTYLCCGDWDGNRYLWEPFSQPGGFTGEITRQLYKNDLGNKVYFEETHRRLDLTFRYRWTFSEQFGFVRTCWLINHGETDQSIDVLDGLQNIIPHGLTQDFQLRYSNLGDAYKKNELRSESQLGLYYLSSIPTDRAEPSEGLRASVVWQLGLERPTVLLSERQVQSVLAGLPATTEFDVRAARGAYLVHQSLQVEAGETIQWNIIADVGYDHTDVINLDKRLHDSMSIDSELAEDIDRSQARLLSIVSACDGRQLSADEISVKRHQANTLFNVMRGGYPVDGYNVEIAAFAQHLRRSNPTAFADHETFLDSLDKQLPAGDLRQQLIDYGEMDLVRAALEYLPLTFGRRHGDPTRPWNAFSIDIRNPNGSAKISYQGNWRDIFQNWEALSLSYPAFAQSMVFRFVNASTADGYNPYRLTNEGFEWEVPEPDNPWSNIGYWGDHQIIYLLKLLQWSRQYDPLCLDRWLDSDCCVYAEIPYRIRDYEAIRSDPHQTIDFDRSLDQAIADRVANQGADGKLLRNGDDQLVRATLGEKLLVPMLAKMTNFVPDGGIWLNTQRPEWNDANNAIVGNGMSMVTVYYLRRYFAFLLDWFTSAQTPHSISVSQEVATLLDQVTAAITPYVDADHQSLHVDAARLRHQVLARLAHAGSDYRQSLYQSGFSGAKVELTLSECAESLRVCLAAMDATIRMNRRDDGLYHSYNLLTFGEDTVEIDHLDEMLEGQVAVLSSGLLSAVEALQVLDALRNSSLYREDQQSYLLYPDRDLPSFVEKNRLAADAVYQSELLATLIADQDATVIRMDDFGDAHFCGDFRNRDDLNVALDRLAQHDKYRDAVQRERTSIHELFEQTFQHRKFTGRSGTFFGYEGLGSIYWHMVSKLALATIENYVWANDHPQSRCDRLVRERLRDHYRDIRDGIGLVKSPAQYGAFPIDPYSHTPRHAGVQQPGMTGQVKEDILSRFAQLGIRIDDGKLSFDPCLFEPDEFLIEPGEFEFVDLSGEVVRIPVERGGFAFTFCQTPILYQRADRCQLVIHTGIEQIARDDSLNLTQAESARLFSRSGEISRIEVRFDPENLPDRVG